MDVSPAGSQTPAAAPGTTISPLQAAQRRELIKSAQVLNSNQAFGNSNELVFMVDRNTHSEIMRVVNRDTQEVVMQIPPDYVLRLAAQFQQTEELQHEDSRTSAGM